MPRARVVISLVPVLWWCERMLRWVMGGGSISCTRSCHSTNQTRFLTREVQSRSGAVTTTRRLVLGKYMAGKAVACQTWLASVFQTVIADVSWQRVIILRGQGAAGKSRSVFLRQVGWLAARGVWCVFETACQAQEQERRNISTVMRQAHPKKGGETTRWIKKCKLNPLFPPQHGRKTC